MEGSIADLAKAMKAKRRVKITRYESDDSGTFSDLVTDTMFQCQVGEPPWRDNEKGFSCIPAGDYEAAVSDHPRHGKVYELKVPSRFAVLVHSGNFVGDSRKKLKADSEGCILPGRAVGTIGGQKALLSSRDALAALMADLDGEPVIISIRWKDGVKPKEAA